MINECVCSMWYTPQKTNCSSSTCVIIFVDYCKRRLLTSLILFQAKIHCRSYKARCDNVKNTNLEQISFFSLEISQSTSWSYTNSLNHTHCNTRNYNFWTRAVDSFIGFYFSETNKSCVLREGLHNTSTQIHMDSSTYTPIKGSKLLFPVIKATEIKN